MSRPKVPKTAASVRVYSPQKKKIIQDIFNQLFAHYGPQHWWPAETSFEVCVGAILVQNTNWLNVEKAIANLRKSQCLHFSGLFRLDDGVLRKLIQPAGFFNVKTKRLKAFLAFLDKRCGGDLSLLRDVPLDELRAELLSVHGIGAETADSILLYALDKPVFVVDAYTKRLLLRHGLINGKSDYQSMQQLFMDHLKQDLRLFNEYHALIVQLGKDFRRIGPIEDDYPLKDKKFFLEE